MNDYLSTGSIGFLAGGLVTFLVTHDSVLAAQPTQQAMFAILAGFAVAAVASGIHFLWRRRVERELDDRWSSQG